MKKKVAFFMIMVAMSVGFTGCSAGTQAAETTSTSSHQRAQTDDQTSGSCDPVTTQKQVLQDDVDPGMIMGEECIECFDGELMMATAPMNFQSVGAEEQPIEWNTEEYKYQTENPWMSVQTSPFSTFAADVDTASYANVRRMLLRGNQVVPDAVRIEEMVNYFRYDYPQPQKGEPFSVTTEMAPCPWNDKTQLLMVGMNAKELDTTQRMKSNLVFLIDVSGSMDTPDKLPLVQRSFKLLCEELGEGDRVSLVTYASGDSVVLDGVSGLDKAKICDAVEDLFANGGTNGSAGIQTAYELAEKYYIKGGNNRVILATDGDLNIGITDEGSLTRLIKDKAKSGVFLSVLGFGQGNISDVNMEALADNGNGNYSYIDSVAEARKVLIEEMGSTLYTVAKDVKLQVEFNPAMVKGYRLIGYENRTMAAEDFADDTKDGGEIGAGHQVTALYEVALKDSEQSIPSVSSRYSDSEQKPTDIKKDEFLTVNVRYKEPDGDTSKLLVYPVDASAQRSSMSDNMSWAAGVAQAGMILKQSEYAGDSTVAKIKARLEDMANKGDDEYRKEFLYLLSRFPADARSISSSDQ